MWIKIALAAGALAVAAAPQVFQASKAGQASLVQTASLGKPPPARFAPTCRGDEVLDSRPDPAWVRASFANDHCQQPGLPPAIDGYTASREAVVAAMAASKRYAVAAGQFQKCVSDFVAARQAEAHHGGMALTPSQIVIENHRILASARAKEIADAQVRVAINAFNEYGSECPDQ